MDLIINKNDVMYLLRNIYLTIGDIQRTQINKFMQCLISYRQLGTCRYVLKNRSLQAPPYYGSTDLSQDIFETDSWIVVIRRLIWHFNLSSNLFTASFNFQFGTPQFRNIVFYDFLNRCPRDTGQYNSSFNFVRASLDSTFQ